MVEQWNGVQNGVWNLLRTLFHCNARLCRVSIYLLTYLESQGLTDWKGMKQAIDRFPWKTMLSAVQKHKKLKIPTKIHSIIHSTIPMYIPVHRLDTVNNIIRHDMNNIFKAHK